MSEPTAGLRTGGWLSLGPASELLGIDPDTLRRWADEGRVPAWTTPGGHRRFDADSLNRLDEAGREAYRRAGRRLVTTLVAYLDADPEDSRRRRRLEAQAGTVVDDQARRLAESGATLTDAVSRFVGGRQPFVAELAAIGRRRSLDPTRLAELYGDAWALLDRLLLRFIDAYQQDA